MGLWNKTCNFDFLSYEVINRSLKMWLSGTNPLSNSESHLFVVERWRSSDKSTLKFEQNDPKFENSTRDLKFLIGNFSLSLTDHFKL